MKSKLEVTLSVIFLVVASLLVAGCTTSNTNQTPNASTATHDALLEKYTLQRIKTTHPTPSAILRCGKSRGSTAPQHMSNGW